MIAPVKPPEGWISGTAEGVACLAKMKNMYTPERSLSGVQFHISNFVY